MGPALPGAWAERQECLGGGGCEKLLVSRAPLEGPLSPCAQLLSGSEVRALGGGCQERAGAITPKGTQGKAQCPMGSSRSDRSRPGGFMERDPWGPGAGVWCLK